MISFTLQFPYCTLQYLPFPFFNWKETLFIGDFVSSKLIHPKIHVVHWKFDKKYSHIVDLIKYNVGPPNAKRVKVIYNKNKQDGERSVINPEDTDTSLVP